MRRAATGRLWAPSAACLLCAAVLLLLLVWQRWEACIAEEGHTS
jgi:hypothetical protein